MNFGQALEVMKNGGDIKRPHWSGFWNIENGNIVMHLKDGSTMDVRETKDSLYTFSNMAAEDWEVADDKNSDLKSGNLIKTFRFGEALRELKAGKKVCRSGWNGKGMFIVYQNGYPQGISCNKQTAIAWGLNEGDLFRCEPYLQIKMTNGSHSMWVPSINDVLAEDWEIVEVENK